MTFKRGWCQCSKKKYVKNYSKDTLAIFLGFVAGHMNFNEATFDGQCYVGRFWRIGHKFGLLRIYHVHDFFRKC